MKQFTQFAGNALACVRCTTLEETEVAIFGFVMPVARNTNMSNAERDGRLSDCALASAQIIQFGPYLARKQEQQRFLARLSRHSSPVAEGDIRARVAAIVEWSTRY